MKIVPLFALFAFVAAADEYYAIPNEIVDIEPIFGSFGGLREFMTCYMDKGPCSKTAASIKKIIPEALEQACRKCSPGLKQRIARFIQVAKLIRPRVYEQLKQHYDPENKYIDSFEDEVFKYLYSCF